MDFSLTEEQVLLRDSVEKFVVDHCDVARHRARCAEQAGPDPAVWQQFAELGWLSVPFSEAQGGFDGGAVDIMVVAQALGGALVREPYLETVVLCGGILADVGSEAQQGAHLPPIIAGESHWALAFAEDNSSFHLDTITTSVQEEGGGFVLSGQKVAVLNGEAATAFIVSARDADGLSLFIVDADAPGVTREGFSAVDGSRGAHVSFENVHVDQHALLGQRSGGLPVLQGAVDRAIVAMAAEGLGAMKSLLSETVNYTKTREQFGQPIGKFQVLQHDMADMYIRVEETQSLLLNAAIALDEGRDDAALACAALKAKLCEAGMFVAKQAIQLHGGIGMTDELIVGHHYKRLLLLSKLFGDEDFYVQRYVELDAASAA